MFIHNPYRGSEIQWRGRRMTLHGNTLQGGGTPDAFRHGANDDPGLRAWDGPCIAR